MQLFEVWCAVFVRELLILIPALWPLQLIFIYKIVPTFFYSQHSTIIKIHKFATFVFYVAPLNFDEQHYFISCNFSTVLNTQIGSKDASQKKSYKYQYNVTTTD